jgi:hypothetical protein
MMRRKGVATGLGVLALLALATTAWTCPVEPPCYEIEKEIELYGDLGQLEVPGWGEVACAPTAAVNSFVYLQNRYPLHYDQKLVPDSDGDGDIDHADMIAVVQILGTSDYMNTILDNGTRLDRFVYGKEKYIEERAGGVTIYSGQTSWSWVGAQFPPPCWVQTSTDPTWEWLYAQLVSCEDVEIGIYQVLVGNSTEEGLGAHAVTLTSFHWCDLDCDGVIDRNEGAWIDFIDPWTGAYTTTPIWQTAFGSSIYTAYFGESYIAWGISESMPEPGAALLLGLGLALLIRRARRRTG